MKRPKLLKPYKVVEGRSKSMYGFIGMNPDAAKRFGMPWHYPNNVILIDETLRGKARLRTEVHEAVEKHYMDKGWSYWKAHKKATKAEKMIR